jgi:opacity protein-like surface antigen
MKKSCKKSYIIAGLGALMATTAFSSAQADERWPRWYLGLSGAYTVMSDEDVSGGTAARKMKLHDGFGIGGSIGYLPSSSVSILNVMRFEAEVVYHQNNIHSVGLAGGGTATSSGSYSSTAYMVNAFYDLPIANSLWSPYIGAGAGFATVHLPTNSGVGNTGSTDNEFAYQFMLGVGYSPVSLPNTQWTLGYRYMATEDPRFGGAGADVKTSYSFNSLEAGAKFRF